MSSADVVVDLIAEGRRLKNNVQQALLFALSFHLVLACSFIMGLLLWSPVEVVPAGTVMWFGLIVVPLLVVSMQWAEAERVEMTKKRIPRLRPGEFGWETRKALEKPRRLVIYFLVRGFPSAFFAVCLFHAVLVESESSTITLETILWGHGRAVEWDPRSCVLAQNVASLALALCALRMSLNAMHRNQSIFEGCHQQYRYHSEEVRMVLHWFSSSKHIYFQAQLLNVSCFATFQAEAVRETYGDDEVDTKDQGNRQPLRVQCGAPSRNKAWLVCVVVVVVGQVMLNGLRDPDLASFGVKGVPWGVWIAMLLWPILMTGVDEGVKKLDARAFGLFNSQLRQLFETRLGMHSPQ